MDVMKIRTSKWGFREIDTGAIGVGEQDREGLSAFKLCFLVVVLFRMCNKAINRQKAPSYAFNKQIGNPLVTTPSQQP